MPDGEFNPTGRWTAIPGNLPEQAARRSTSWCPRLDGAQPRCLRHGFGTPAVAGCPVGSFSETLFDALERSARDGQTRLPYLDGIQSQSSDEAQTAVIGEAVQAGSIVAACAAEQRGPVRVVVRRGMLSSAVRGPVISVNGRRQSRRRLAARKP